MLAASALGCSSERAQPDASPELSSAPAQVITFEQVTDLMTDPVARQELLDAVAQEPDEHKPGGLSYGTALLTIDGAALDEAVADPDEARLLIANLGSERMTGNVACVAETSAVPCDNRADVITLDIPARHAASQHIQVAPQVAITNVLVVPDGEADRVLVLAGRRQIGTQAAPPPHWSPSTQDTPIMDPEAFGCGTAWIVDQTSPHDGYQPIRNYGREDPLWLTVEPCPEAIGTVGQLLLIIDGATVEVVGHGYFETPSTTIAVDIRDLITNEASTVQAAYLTIDEQATSFSQAVTFG